MNADHDGHEQVEARLAELREHPERLKRWDLDRDGELDEREWALVRRMVEHEVESRRRRSTPVTTDFEPEVLNDRYEIVGLLGRGGQAETFLALDREHDDRHVVAKVLEIKVASDWKAIELFEREGQVLERLDHPRIPAYIDHFHIEGQDAIRFVIIQQFIDGDDLGQLLEKGRTWSVDEANTRLREIADILAYLHDRRPPVVHRDIKPSNLILGRNDELYLVDFGAAQNIVPATVGGSTIIGTSGYVPMEQYMGRASAASDVYALGATALHMVSGVHPADMDLDCGKLRFDKYVQDNALSEILTQTLDHLENRVPDGGALRSVLALASDPQLSTHRLSEPPPTTAIVTSDTRSVDLEARRSLVGRQWSERVLEGTIALRDPTRDWIAISRDGTSISRTIGKGLQTVTITTTKHALSLSANNLKLRAVAGIVALASAIAAAAFASPIVSFAGFATCCVALFFAGIPHVLLSLSPGGWQSDWSSGSLDDVEVFEVSNDTVMMRLTDGTRRLLKAGELPPAARAYTVQVLNHGLDQLKNGRPFDIADVW